MKKINFLILLLAINTIINSQVNIIHDFGSSEMFVNMKVTSLFSDSSNLYGISYNSRIFKISLPGNTYSEIYKFQGDSSQGNFMIGGLALIDTTFYGVTLWGGLYSDGTIYKISKNGFGFSKILDFDFNNGALPVAELVTNGNVLYGMTSDGASGGVIFRYNLDGIGYKKLYDFSLSAGCRPLGAITIIGSELFGTTLGCGSNDCGVIFKIKNDGTGYSKLLEFNGTNGGNPHKSLLHADTVLFGVTSKGGKRDSGTIFKIRTDGTGFKTLYSFSGSTGTNPCSPLVMVGSQLYGLAINYQHYARNILLYQVQSDGTGYEVWHDFGMCGTEIPEGYLTFTGNSLYGFINAGGTNYGPVLFSYELNPVITRQPLNNINSYNGNTAGYRVIARGSELTYHWQVSDDTGKSWAPISSGTVNAVYNGWDTDSLIISGITSNCNGLQYRCVITGHFADTLISQPVTLLSPVIKMNPSDALACLDGSASFSLSASGTGLGYQWQLKVGSGWENLINSYMHSGVNESTLRLFNASTDIDGSEYRCIVMGSVNVQDTSSIAKLMIGSYINFSRQPVSVSVQTGKTALFSVKAQGSFLLYKWQISANGGNNWDDITGTGSSPVPHGWTTDSLWLTNINKFSNGYEFRCIAYNQCTSVTSQVGILEVIAGIKSLNPGSPELFLFPNPSRFNVNLQFSGTETGPVVITICNSMGQAVSQIHSKKIERIFNYNIALPVLAKGIYYISVVCNGKEMGWSKLNIVE